MNPWIIVFFAATFILTVICGWPVIPFLRKLKVGQTERENGPESHLKKNGTPTMGGIIFLLPMLAVCLVAFFTGVAPKILPLVIVTILYSAVGFADDFLKVVKRNKDGLLWYQKLIILVVLSVLFGLYMQFYGIGTWVDIAFFGLHTKINLSFMFAPFCALLMVASSNAVNITDGLDGLCAGSVAIVTAFFTLVSVIISKNTDTAVFSAVLCGGLLGFLVFNHSPAKVFMGDTGSLALGGALGALAINLQMPFILILAGLLFVIETLSVIIQVGYFKISKGKRFFKMAPIHHHFELSGWSEKKVVIIFWAFTLVCCVAAYFCLAL